MDDAPAPPSPDPGSLSDDDLTAALELVVPAVAMPGAREIVRDLIVAALVAPTVDDDTLTEVTRGAVLRAAADKLDQQAAAHGQGIHDYTDLLRAWAVNTARWNGGC